MMQTYTISEDIRVFCLLVPDFPMGIQGAFNKLVKQFGNEGRAYYGVSYMDEQCRIVYKAAVSVKDGEEKDYDYELFAILKGEYWCEELTDWMQKTNEIKNVFGRLMEQPDFDNTYPCIEWYKNDREMFCLVRKKVE